MDIINKAKYKYGYLEVQIEGFFTERFINLCRINNIQITKIRNIVPGVVRFEILIKDFKKLRKIARKTKSKVKIKKKSGIYFRITKYKKRKIILILALLLIVLMIASSCFIWKIEVCGNTYLQKEKIIKDLKDSGVYIGKFRLNIDKKKVINNMRIVEQDITWAGLDFDGTKAILTIVEKTRLDEDEIQNTKFGNIVATKSGILTRIIPSNGTAIYKEGSYIQKDSVLIEGAIYNKYIENKKVTAKGIVRANCEYNFDLVYYFNDIEKEYTNKTKYRFNFGTDDKNIINSLNKLYKYDITKSEKKIHIFKFILQFNTYKCKEYVEKNVIKTEDEIFAQYEKESNNLIEKSINENCENGVLLKKQYTKEVDDEKIIYHTVYNVEENIGKFVEADENVDYLLKREENNSN